MILNPEWGLGFLRPAEINKYFQARALVGGRVCRCRFVFGGILELLFLA